jgi:hypothetical protein
MLRNIHVAVWRRSGVRFLSNGIAGTLGMVLLLLVTRVDARRDIVRGSALIC